MSDAASSVVYTERHDRMMRLLKAGDVSVVDEAIDFLEADLDDLFAGYERERIYGHLAHYDLTDAQADRLRRFGLSRCRGKRRRHEFRKLRVLARSLATASWVAELRSLPRSEDATDREAEEQFIESVAQAVRANE